MQPPRYLTHETEITVYNQSIDGWRVKCRSEHEVFIRYPLENEKLIEECMRNSMDGNPSVTFKDMDSFFISTRIDNKFNKRPKSHVSYKEVLPNSKVICILDALKDVKYGVQLKVCIETANNIGTVEKVDVLNNARSIRDIPKAMRMTRLPVGLFLRHADVLKTGRNVRIGSNYAYVEDTDCLDVVLKLLYGDNKHAVYYPHEVLVLNKFCTQYIDCNGETQPVYKLVYEYLSTNNI